MIEDLLRCRYQVHASHLGLGAKGDTAVTQTVIPPTFSICHATARLPLGWRPAYEAWKGNADNWSKVEYLLAVDSADLPRLPAVPDDVAVVENKLRPCCNDAWNEAARVSTGRFLITASDDMYPPPHWDTEILKVIPSLDGEYVVDVKSGTSPGDDEWAKWMLISLLTRPYYERYGYIFYPDFLSMYNDLWFTEQARADGVVIDARHLTIQHKHWIGTTVAQDEVYRKSGARERYEQGESVIGALRARKAVGECLEMRRDK